MSTRITKPWRLLTKDEINGLPAQLGVYQLSSDASTVDFVGYAGAKSQFGLRGELSRWLGTDRYFRIEITTAYMTRFRELLMIFEADHGYLPETDQIVPGLGRLSPMGDNV